MKIVQTCLAALTLSLLAACGGGGDGAALEGSISGTVTKGPLRNATLAAYAIGNGQRGSQIGTAMTDADGRFSLMIASHSGPVMLQAGGGTYTNEATGSAMTPAPGNVMTAVMTSVAGGASIGGIQVTPLTAMAQARAQMMSGGMTDANINAANAAVGNYFSVSDILHTAPMNPLLAGSGTGATADARNHGMVLAAMSQYAKGIDMAVSSALVTAMMSDAADGMMDGRNGATPISMSMGGMMGTSMMAPTAGTSGLATAMTAFMNSAMNKSGLSAADMAPLIAKLGNATGQLP